MLDRDVETVANNIVAEKISPEPEPTPIEPRVKSYIATSDVESEIAIKTVIVGDGQIGKTCLIDRLIDNPFDDTHEATTWQDHEMNLTAEREDGTERIIRMDLVDTAGQEGFEGIRGCCYPGTNLFLIAYKTDSTLSLNNLRRKWHDELVADLDFNKGDDRLRPDHTEPWYILVGCQADRADSDFTRGEDEAVAEELNVCAFIRTSALVTDVFSAESGVNELKQMITNLACMYRDGMPKPSWKDFKNPEQDPYIEKYLK